MYVVFLFLWSEAHQIKMSLNLMTITDVRRMRIITEDDLSSTQNSNQTRKKLFWMNTLHITYG